MTNFSKTKVILEGSSTKYFMRFINFSGTESNVAVDKMEKMFKSMDVEYDDKFMQKPSDLVFSASGSDVSKIDAYIKKNADIKLVKRV